MVNLTYAAALVCAGAALVQAASKVPTITKPSTSSNGQSACVQFGDCTSLPKSNTYKTETQYSPITSPHSTKVPNLSDKGQTQSYMSSYANAGASQAYATNPKPKSKTPVPPPTTVTYAHKTTSGSKTYTTTEVHQDSARFDLAPNAAFVYALAATAVASLAGIILL